MARKKKNSGLSLLSILMMLGVVLSIVGLFVAFFASTTEVFGKSVTETCGLFAEELSDLAEINKEVDGDLFPIAIIRIVAIAGAVLSLGCLAVAIFGNVKGLAKLLLAGVTIALGVLVFVFGGIYAGDLTTVVTKWTLGVGAYLNGIGIIMSGAAYLLKR